ncbi:MAG: PIN domain-containing protein [Verrucomicrobia bacterium]|nr:PIN domain-containing protein [Verrucomicrobiota bacterium]MCH8511050.1 PIN domain-containing protein [Kiritimatiellia bacterium]
MEVILDTNALSAWLDGDPGLKPLLDGIQKLFLSPIVLGEYRFGIAASRHRIQYEKILAELLSDIEVLPLDDRVAGNYADIRRELKKNGTPIPWHDIWIAAQARSFFLPVLSNDKHFDAVPLLSRIGW